MGLLPFCSIVAFPEKFDHTVLLFELPREHKLVARPQLHDVTYLSGLLLPMVTALTLAFPAILTVDSVIKPAVWLFDWFVVVLQSFILLFLVATSSHAFGTDAKPLDFNTQPSVYVYIAIFIPFLDRPIRHVFKSVRST